MEKKSKTDVTKYIVYGFVISTLILTLIFIIVSIVKAPSVSVDYEKTKTDYSLQLVMTLLGIIGLLVPTFIGHKFKLDYPNFLIFLYLIFLYGAVFLGEIRYFYYKIPFWDDILHSMSSCMFAIISFSIINFLNKKDIVHLNPFFVSLFAFCFAFSIGAIWEIMEFTIDELMGLNSQKWATEDGIALIGHEAITDTMMDLIVDASGALLVSVIAFISMCGKQKFIKNVLIKNKESIVLTDEVDSTNK